MNKYLPQHELVYSLKWANAYRDLSYYSTGLISILDDMCQ